MSTIYVCVCVCVKSYNLSATFLSWRQNPMTRKSNLWQHYGIEKNSYENKTQIPFHMTYTFKIF